MLDYVQGVRRLIVEVLVAMLSLNVKVCMSCIIP